MLVLLSYAYLRVPHISKPGSESYGTLEDCNGFRDASRARLSVIPRILFGWLECVVPVRNVTSGIRRHTCRGKEGRWPVAVEISRNKVTPGTKGHKQLLPALLVVNDDCHPNNDADPPESQLSGSLQVPNARRCVQKLELRRMLPWSLNWPRPI